MKARLTKNIFLGNNDTQRVKIMLLLKKSQINNILHRIGKLRLLVIGDCMLDHYVFGDVSRISPEAPVPVVQVERESYRLGGACNVALNIKQLGAQVKLMGWVGNDKGGRVLKSLLAKAGIDFNNPVEREDVQTIVKTRVVVRNQQLCRLDRESLFLPCLVDYLKLSISSHIKSVDGVIISDYGKGTICQVILDHLTELKWQNKFFLAVDPKPVHELNYSGVDLLTPNRNEALQLAKRVPSSASHVTIKELAKSIFEMHAIRHLAVTLSRDGIAIVEPNFEVMHFPTMAREVFDVSGAGDTAIAALTLALCANTDIAQAAYFANLAAGIVVGKVGTATTSAAEILSYVDTFQK